MAGDLPQEPAVAVVGHQEVEASHQGTVEREVGCCSVADEEVQKFLVLAQPRNLQAAEGEARASLVGH